MAGNHALDVNPPNADLHISKHGSDWLWAALGFIGFSLLVTTILTFLAPRGSRLFHQLCLIVLATTTIAYFSMASDLGSTPIRVEFRDGGKTRQIWYVRYIQWFIAYPTLLLAVLLPTGISTSDIVTTIFMAWVTVISGLVGALVASSYKWGYYVFGLLGIFYVWHMLLGVARRTTFPTEFRLGYTISSSFLAFMLLGYPICWALAEGSNVITPTSEMIWYGILDCIAGPIFVFVYLFLLRSVDYDALGLQSFKYTDRGVPRTTKAAEAAAVAPATETGAV